MVKNKDCFRALPIKERAALINKYVSGGVMDLGEMKRHYNSFAPGGVRRPCPIPDLRGKNIQSFTIY